MVGGVGGVVPGVHGRRRVVRVHGSGRAVIVPASVVAGNVILATATAAAASNSAVTTAPVLRIVEAAPRRILIVGLASSSVIVSVIRCIEVVVRCGGGNLRG